MAQSFRNAGILPKNDRDSASTLGTVTAKSEMLYPNYTHLLFWSTLKGAELQDHKSMICKVLGLIFECRRFVVECEAYLRKGRFLGVIGGCIGVESEGEAC